ncbi:hypothetical protein [Paucibacter sp. XJ19-41]|uniref:hypothetical protein n=1 Tax=Paucibacter sp. XJ19-41 TaxID=2927824 RepID=UPI002349CE6F|nr:hypothetical protein [Paucibacter sp. XJ19-41]MDC6168666.1 hypothetical protein [Paucibacter sp. XJ19-41]
MSDVREDLLRPSLPANGALAAAPYSNQVLFLSAFFGGPPAALGCFALNSLRLGRWRRDVVPIAAGAAIYLGLLLWWQRAGPELIAIPRMQSLLLRALGLALAGVAAWRHRQEQSVCRLMGLAQPKGLLPGIALIVLAWAVGGLLQVLLS